MLKKVPNIFLGNNYNLVQFTQTSILISILLVGIYIFGLNLDIYKLLITFFGVVGFDLLFEYIFLGKRKEAFLNLSKINMAFGILFFIRSDFYLVYLFAAFVASLSKYIFLYKGKHFLNPSNFAVSLVLLLFPPYAYTNPLQWTFDITNSVYWISFLIVCILGFVLIEYFLYKYLKTHQIFLILAFILTHIFLYFNIGLNEPILGALDFFSISFLIFAFFMITDPKTTPKYQVNKILFGISIAVSFYVLTYFVNENFAIIWSLFINTLFLPLIWYFEDNYNGYKKYIGGITTLFFYTLLLIILFNIYGHQDLQFTNRCISIICKQ